METGDGEGGGGWRKGLFVPRVCCTYMYIGTFVDELMAFLENNPRDVYTYPAADLPGACRALALGLYAHSTLYGVYCVYTIYSEAGGRHE